MTDTGGNVGQGQQKQTEPAQHQNQQPCREYEMHPKPMEKDNKYKGNGKLQGKVAIITGGDSDVSSYVTGQVLHVGGGEIVNG
jgi:hypothetical protein